MFGVQGQGQGQSQSASLFSGGGFMPSQPTPSVENNFSSSSKKNANSGLLPLTVKQISQATQKLADENSNYSIDGVDVNNVTLVGLVLNKEERVTDISFQIDDGTGRVDVKRWVNDTTESVEMANVQNGAYVRVHGHLRSFQSNRHINAFSVRPVTDFNEVTYHFLECIYTHLCNLKAQGRMPSLASPAVKGVSVPPSVLNRSQQNSFMSEGPVLNDGFTDELHSRVQSIFEEPRHLAVEQGVHVDELCRRLPGYTKKQVMDAILFLCNEGTIYSTVDEEHYKSVNAA